MGRSTRRGSSARGPAWTRWPSDEILDLRLCDLGVRIDGTWLEDAVERLQRELEAAGIRLRPHFWLSDEWFSPAGVPGVAIPFYLAHPRLMRLERAQMLDVEGGSRAECLRLLRHEVGHAVQHAWELHRRRRWQQVFGKSSEPYPDWYLPNPASKRYVQHLDAWYAQSHPDEDFAETFAVWLQPRSGWRRRYDGWPALEKLTFVDELMAEIAGTRPKVARRIKPDSLPRLRKTLREHYAAKRARYSAGHSDIYDRDLMRLFGAPVNGSGGEPAAAFLRRNREEVRELVSRWTGGYRFTLDQVLKDIIGRCRELKLRAAGSEPKLKLDFAILLTVHSMRCLYRGRQWHPL